MNEPGGAFDFSDLTTDGLDHIEIVRGPQSALYGSDAVTSVVTLHPPRGRAALRAPRLRRRRVQDLRGRRRDLGWDRALRLLHRRRSHRYRRYPRHQQPLREHERRLALRPEPESRRWTSRPRCATTTRASRHRARSRAIASRRSTRTRSRNGSGWSSGRARSGTPFRGGATRSSSGTTMTISLSMTPRMRASIRVRPKRHDPGAPVGRLQLELLPAVPGRHHTHRDARGLWRDRILRTGLLLLFPGFSLSDRADETRNAGAFFRR